MVLTSIDKSGTHRVEGYVTDIITQKAIDWLQVSKV